MKKIISKIAVIGFLSIGFQQGIAQNHFPASGSVGIGIASPNSKSILDITSTTKGVLFPRMTLTQRNAIASPPAGLLIYQTNSTPGLYSYTGSAWKAVTPTVTNYVRGLNDNLWIGQNAATSNTTGKGTIALGKAALRNNTVISNLVAIGDSALYNNGIGAPSGYGVQNVAVGFAALKNNTTGYTNTAVGYEALKANIDGEGNSAFGTSALSRNTSGVSNTALGKQTLYVNINGSYNVALGNNAMLGNNSGSSNTAVGNSALSYNYSGGSNTAVGLYALLNNQSSYNVGVGLGTLQQTTYSQYNTAVGYNAAVINDQGYNNVFVGANSTGAGIGLYNIIAIGQGTSVSSASTARFGNSSTASYGGYADWSNISDGRYKRNIQTNVPGMEFINKLRPVTYNLDATGLDAYLHKDDPEENKLSKEGQAFHNKALKEKEAITYTGFIAQEVEASAKELGFDFSGVDAPRSANDVYGLRYAEFVVPLVKAVQELGKANEKLKMKNEELEKKVERINSVLNADQQQQLNEIQNTKASLAQNIPNPFNKCTVINYYVSEKFTDAELKIYSSQGVEMKTYTIKQSGKGALTMEANTLAAGIYSYTLIVDGNAADVKQMIITK